MSQEAIDNYLDGLEQLKQFREVLKDDFSPEQELEMVGRLDRIWFQEMTEEEQDKINQNLRALNKNK